MPQPSQFKLSICLTPLILIVALGSFSKTGFSHDHLGEISYTPFTPPRTKIFIKAEIREWIHSGTGTLDWKNKEQLIQELKSVGNSKEQIDYVLRYGSTMENGRYKVSVDESIWNSISHKSRDAVFKSFSNAEESQIGLKVNLTITPSSDLTAIAKKYAGERTQAPLKGSYAFISDRTGRADSIFLWKGFYLNSFGKIWISMPILADQIVSTQPFASTKAKILKENMSVATTNKAQLKLYSAS